MSNLTINLSPATAHKPSTDDQSDIFGEIDIVAADVGESGLRLVFCEVKSGCGLGFGHPLEAISVPDRVGYVDRGFAGAAEVLRAHLQEWPLAQ